MRQTAKRHLHWNRVQLIIVILLVIHSENNHLCNMKSSHQTKVITNSLIDLFPMPLIRWILLSLLITWISPTPIRTFIMVLRIPIFLRTVCSLHTTTPHRMVSSSIKNSLRWILVIYSILHHFTLTILNSMSIRLTTSPVPYLNLLPMNIWALWIKDKTFYTKFSILWIRSISQWAQCLWCLPVLHPWWTINTILSKSYNNWQSIWTQHHIKHMRTNSMQSLMKTYMHFAPKSRKTLTCWRLRDNTFLTKSTKHAKKYSQDNLRS